MHEVAATAVAGPSWPTALQPVADFMVNSKSDAVLAVA